MFKAIYMFNCTKKFQQWIIVIIIIIHTIIIHDIYHAPIIIVCSTKIVYTTKEIPKLSENYRQGAYERSQKVIATKDKVSHENSQKVVVQVDNIKII